MGEARNESSACEEVSLSKAAEYLLEECRMVLPGLQALFGFQMIAVFNDGFSTKLSPIEQRLHLLAITLVVVAIALIMTPAAYHRQNRAKEISETFIRISTRLLLWSMAPLALGIVLDFYLVGRLILSGVLMPVITAVLLALFLILWFALPRSHFLRRLLGGPLN